MPELAELCDSEDVAELVAAHADLFGVGLAVVSPSGERVTAAGPGVDAPGLGHHTIHPIYFDGERAFDVVIGPYRKKLDRAPSDPGVRVEREPPGSVDALAAAIPELALAEVERLGRHLERVVLAVLRAAQARRRPENPAPVAEPAPGPAVPVDPASMRREIERAKSTFLATVSHELRTPLTSVIGYSEMLIEGMAGPITDEQREFLSTILSKSDHLLRLITSMLDLARVDSTPPPVEQMPISILEVIERAATSLTGEVDRRAIALSLPAGPVPRVMADPRKIGQVLVHLIANAIKFTPRGGDVVVATEVGPLAPGDRSSAEPSPRALAPDELVRRFGVRISVRDTGIGISPVAQARIFEPFFQADQTSTREYGGTGLGLSLAKSYVEAHGGSIWVSSLPGHGSTFTLSLPAVPEELVAYLGQPGRPERR